MTRIDNVGIVVEDLTAAIAFFKELGLELEGEARVQGSWVDGTVGLTGVLSDIAMMRTADGNSRIELSTFLKPAATRPDKQSVANTLGIGRIMFQVDDIDDMLHRLSRHGATLVGNVEQYEDQWRLCYLRGPEGIMLALAEKLK